MLANRSTVWAGKTETLPREQGRLVLPGRKITLRPVWSHAQLQAAALPELLLPTVIGLAAIGSLILAFRFPLSGPSSSFRRERYPWSKIGVSIQQFRLLAVGRVLLGLANPFR
jgi:hypothetical protein